MYPLEGNFFVAMISKVFTGENKTKQMGLYPWKCRKILSLCQHHTDFKINRKMNIMENHFTNIVVILANNEIESKINLMMTHAICCLAWSKTKLNILSPHTTCLQPFNKSSIHFLKVLGAKWLVGNLLAQVTISDNPTQLVVGVNVLEAVEWIEEVYRGWKMSAIMFCDDWFG